MPFISMRPSGFSWGDDDEDDWDFETWKAAYPMERSDAAYEPTSCSVDFSVDFDHDTHLPQGPDCLMTNIECGSMSWSSTQLTDENPNEAISTPTSEYSATTHHPVDDQKEYYPRNPGTVESEPYIQRYAFYEDGAHCVCHSVAYPRRSMPFRGPCFTGRSQSGRFLERLLEKVEREMHGRDLLYRPGSLWKEIDIDEHDELEELGAVRYGNAPSLHGAVQGSFVPRNSTLGRLAGAVQSPSIAPEAIPLADELDTAFVNDCIDVEMTDQPSLDIVSPIPVQLPTYTKMGFSLDGVPEKDPSMTASISPLPTGKECFVSVPPGTPDLSLLSVDLPLHILTEVLKGNGISLPALSGTNQGLEDNVHLGTEGQEVYFCQEEVVPDDWEEDFALDATQNTRQSKDVGTTTTPIGAESGEAIQTLNGNSKYSPYTIETSSKPGECHEYISQKPSRYLALRQPEPTAIDTVSEDHDTASESSSIPEKIGVDTLPALAAATDSDDDFDIPSPPSDAVLGYYQALETVHMRTARIASDSSKISREGDLGEFDEEDSILTENTWPMRNGIQKVARTLTQPLALQGEDGADTEKGSSTVVDNAWTSQTECNDANPLTPHEEQSEAWFLFGAKATTMVTYAGAALLIGALWYARRRR